MTFICKVETPIRHCSNITHTNIHVLHNTKNATAKTDQTK